MDEESKQIKLVLHHNYLKITKGEIKLQLPVRCAKIIHDMYENRNAENEEKDIKHYIDKYNNFEYKVSVHQMNAKYNSELVWNKTTIKPLELEEDE